LLTECLIQFVFHRTVVEMLSLIHTENDHYIRRKNGDYSLPVWTRL